VIAVNSPEVNVSEVMSPRLANQNLLRPPEQLVEQLTLYPEVKQLIYYYFIIIKEYRRVYFNPPFF
jgi:uncharacterized membrane protein YagU involved in acid resistance